MRNQGNLGVITSRVRTGISLIALAVAATLISLLVLTCRPAVAASQDAPPYVIAVHLSSENRSATGPEEVHAIRHFVTRRVELLNASGGINGRRVAVAFFDDHSDGEETKANVDRALTIPNLIAMVGLSNSTRGAPVVERIGNRGVPLISEISVETLFADYPNIFSLTRSVRDEHAVFREFSRDGYKKIAFVGAEDDLYTKVYREHIEASGSEVLFVSTFWLKGKIEDHAGDVERAIDDIKNSGADLIFLSIGSKRGAAFLKRLSAAGVEIPVFIGRGSIKDLVADASGGGQGYQGSLYEIAEGGIANLYNERLEKLMRRPDTPEPEKPYSKYAVGYGTRYADLVALIAEAATEGLKAEITAKRPAPDIGVLRSLIAQEIGLLEEGKRVWRGWAQDWSFTRERASSERCLLVWRPKGASGSILAPTQYVRTGSDRVSRVPVLYVHLDMERIFHVDSNDKSFEAEFYFTSRSDPPVPMDSIEFTNAELSPETAKPMVYHREVHQEPADAAGKPGARVYKVSGRFRFEPDLRKYPFDEQIFSISFQPVTTAAAFFIQPPAESVRGHVFSVDGWRVGNHYVGTNELIIRSISGPSSEERVIPYYNFNYTWVMKRQVVDYILRVVVPLTFILIVAYVAIFIPRSEFEAIMGIQVTALLSAIALYLALNQPAADDATLSDIIFLMAYAAISAMIAISVLEVNTTIAQSEVMLHMIHVVQVYLVPVVALATIGIVIAAASYDLSVPEMLGRMLR